MAQIRNNVDIVKGDELWLFIGETETTHPICFATQHQLSRSLATNSISSKDHAGSSCVIPGEDSWTCSSESLMSIADGPDGAYAFEKIMDLYETHAQVYVKFGKLSNYVGSGIVDVDVTGTPQANGWEIGTPYWTGVAYINNLQATAAHGDSATFSIELQGNGPLKKNSVTPTTHSITKTGTGASYVTLSANSAAPGTVIRVTPTSGHGQSDLTVTSSVTLSWTGSYWQFTMPNANVTITVTYNEPSPTTYYFSVGLTEITPQNYTTANNATTTIPTSSVEYSAPEEGYGWILIPSNKTVSIVDKATQMPINYTEQTSIVIANQKVYRTDGALSTAPGAIIITLT